MGKLVARTDEPTRETHIETILQPKCVKTLPIVDLLLCKEEVFSKQFDGRPAEGQCFGNAVRDISIHRWETRFMTEVCSGFNFPSEAMRLWMILRRRDRFVDDCSRASRRLTRRSDSLCDLPGSRQLLETLSRVFQPGDATLAYMSDILACPRLPWRILSTLSRILSIRSTTL